MRRLEQLSVQYLESIINHRNVLAALANATTLRLYFIKEFCLRFVVKESNYNAIVMSNEFETLDQPLMVEIIRRRQMPHVRAPVEPQFDSNGTCHFSTHWPTDSTVSNFNFRKQLGTRHGNVLALRWQGVHGCDFGARSSIITGSQSYSCGSLFLL